MKIIGLTGSIGMGKSTAAAMFVAMGIPVHDSDAAVHTLLNKDGAGVAPVSVAFPGCIDAQRGGIDRRALRALLARDNAQWSRLESIIHPLVQQSQQDFLRAQRLKNVDLVVLDIPLLFETGAEKRVDVTICVTCPDFMQRQRVLARPGMTEEDFAFRLSRQMSNAEKCRRADFVVQTGLGLAQTNKELKTIVAQLKGRGLGHEGSYSPS